MTSAGYALTEKDAYYLASIGRMLPPSAFGEDTPRNEGDVVDATGLAALSSLQVRFEVACEGIEGLSLRGEIAADNRNHLDCMIDEISRKSRPSETRP